jgi:DNA-binding beta-propeller fold protein YncE
MSDHKTTRHVVAAVIAVAVVLAATAGPALATPSRWPLNGSLWVANRGDSTIRGFDAATGDELMTVAMRANSQPGDLAYASGKLYVAEEFGSPPAIAIVDPATGQVLDRVPTGPRPHHVHASVGGQLIAYGVFGTNRVGVIDTGSDTLLGEWPASDNPAARSHAGVFSPDGRTLYVANDVTDELAAVDPISGELLWIMTVPKAHELVVMPDGRTAFVSSRAANLIRIVDLTTRQIVRSIAVGPLPDTLRLSANQRLLTVGLRGSPAQVAFVDTETFDVRIVTIGGAGTTAGHQWTSPSGRFTFAAFEGPGAGVAVLDGDVGNAVVETLPYPGRPHGITFARP